MSTGQSQSWKSLSKPLLGKGFFKEQKLSSLQIKHQLLRRIFATTQAIYNIISIFIDRTIWNVYLLSYNFSIYYVIYYLIFIKVYTTVLLMY